MNLSLKRPIEPTKDKPRKWWQYIISLVINELNTKNSNTLKDYILKNNLNDNNEIKNDINKDKIDKNDFLSYFNHLESIGIPLNIIKEHSLLINNSSFYKNLQQQQEEVPLTSSSSIEDLIIENNMLRGNLVMLAAVAYSMTENVVPPIIINPKDEIELNNINNNNSSFIHRSTNVSAVSPIEIVDESVLSDVDLGLGEIEKNDSDSMFKNLTILPSNNSTSLDNVNTININDNDDNNNQIIVINNTTRSNKEDIKHENRKNDNKKDKNKNKINKKDNKHSSHHKSSRLVPTREVAIQSESIQAPELQEIIQPHTVIRTLEQYNNNNNSNHNMLQQYSNVDVSLRRSNEIGDEYEKENKNVNGIEKGMFKYIKGLTLDHPNLTVNVNNSNTKKVSRKNTNNNNNNNNNSIPVPPIHSPTNTRPISSDYFEHPYVPININTTPSYNSNTNNINYYQNEHTNDNNNKNIIPLSMSNGPTTNSAHGLDLDITLHANYGLQPQVDNINQNNNSDDNNNNNNNQNMIQFPSMRDLTLAAHARPFIDSRNTPDIVGVPPIVASNENINTVNNDNHNNYYNNYDNNDTNIKPYIGLNRPLPTQMQIQTQGQAPHSDTSYSNNNNSIGNHDSNLNVNNIYTYNNDNKNININNNNCNNNDDELDIKAKSILKYLKNHPPSKNDLEFQYEPINPKMFEMKLPWLDRRGKSTFNFHKRDKQKKPEFSAAADKYRVLHEKSPREDKYAIEKIDIVLDKYKNSQKRHAELDGEAHHDEIEKYKEDDDYDSIGSHSTVKFAVKAIANGRAFHSGKKEFRTRPLQPLEKELFGSYYARSLLTAKQKKITKSALFQAT